MIPTNGSAPLNKSVARALDKKYLQTTSPDEPLVQIQNHLCFWGGAFNRILYNGRTVYKMAPSKQTYLPGV